MFGPEVTESPVRQPNTTGAGTAAIRSPACSASAFLRPSVSPAQVVCETAPVQQVTQELGPVALRCGRAALPVHAPKTLGDVGDAGVERARPPCAQPVKATSVRQVVAPVLSAGVPNNA